MSRANGRNLLNEQEMRALVGAINPGTGLRIVINLRDLDIFLPEGSQAFREQVIPRIENELQIQYRNGLLPLRNNYTFDFYALCRVTRNGVNFRDAKIFQLDVTQYANFRLEVASLAPDLRTADFQVLHQPDLGEYITRALETYEDDIDATGKHRSGARYNRDIIGDLFGPQPQGRFQVPQIILIYRGTAATVDEEFIYAQLLNREEEEKAGFGPGALRYKRRYGRGDPLRVLHLVGDDVRRQIILGRIRRANQAGRNLYSYMFTSYKIQSFKYSDFQFMDMASPSYEYGICTLETFEHIRTNGEIIKSQNSHHTAALKAMFVREMQIERFQQNGFNSVEEQMILSGDVFGTMIAYKSKYPDKVFALFSTHDQKIYFADINDDTCEIRQLVYDQFDENRLIEIFGMSDWWAVYERMHLCPLKKDQMIQFYREERLRYNGKFQELLAKVVRHNAQDLIARGNSRLVERVDDMIDIAEVGRDGKPKPAYKLTCTGKRLQDHQKVYSFLVRQGRCALSEEDYLRIETPLSSDPDIREKFKNLNLEKIQKTGIMSFDIETVITPIDQLSVSQLGNAAPIMLCVYGYAYVDANQCAAIGGIELDAGDRRVIRVEVYECFKGLNCVDRFVTWLLESGVMRMSPLDTDIQNGQRSNKHEYLKDYQNILIAHNGAKFDFRWLFDRISKYSEINIVGDLSHLKSFTAKNLSFVDTVQILPFSLKKLCKAVGTVKQKFPYDVEGVTYENYEEKFEELEIYCRRDCECLHEAYLKYVTERSSTYYNDRGFIDKIFPISASSGAVDLFRQLYMEDDIKCYKEVYDTLSPYYMGGITCAYSAYCRFGVSFDVNGSYNAAMHNLIPTEPVWDPLQRKFVRLYQTTVYSSRNETNLMQAQHSQNFFSEGFRFKNTSCYKVTAFKYHDEELHPSITQKTDGRLYHTLVSTDACWVWGVKLNYTLSCQRVVIEIGEMIEFKESHLFRRFVEDKSRMRKEAKRAGNVVMDLIHKLDSNSVYGKMGQALNDKVFYGTKQQVEEFCVAKNVLDESFKITELKPVISTRCEMYCLRYQTDRLSESQIGHMKHAASYITTLGHIYLFRMIHMVAQKFTPEEARICYTDTDSTFVDISKGFSLEDQQRILLLQTSGQDIAGELEDLTTLQQKIQDYNVLVANGLKQPNEESVARERDFARAGGADRIKQLKDQMSDVYAQVRHIYHQNEVLKFLFEQNTVDAREMQHYENPHYALENQVPIVDESIPGSYKIEKFITEGIFLGSKMYAVQCFDVEAMTKLVKKCKMKGVREDKRVYEDYHRLYDSIFAQQYDTEGVDYRERITRGCIVQIDQVQFRSLDTGVRICNIIKYIAPTLYKRRFKDSFGRHSVPFSSYNELLLFEGQYKSLYKLLKEKVKGIIADNIRASMTNDSAIYRESDRQIGRAVIENFNEELKQNEVEIVEQEEEKNERENDQRLIHALFNQDQVARPMVLTKITMHSDSFDKLVEIIIARGYEAANMLVMEVVDEMIRVYNQSYHHVFIRDRFFDLKKVRATVLKLLFVHNFCCKVLGNNLLFADLIQYVDRCVQDSYLAEEDRNIRKKIAGELIKIVENQFDFFVSELFERVGEYVEVRRSEKAERERFMKSGALISQQIDEAVKTSHQNRSIKGPSAQSLFSAQVRKALDVKVKSFAVKMEKFKDARLAVRMEQHIAHVREILNYYIRASNNDLERLAIDFRNFVRDKVSIRYAKDESTKIKTSFLFWRRMTGNDQLLYDDRWDKNRHWEAAGPVITGMSKEFWAALIPENFDYRAEEEDDEEVAVNQLLRRQLRRVIGEDSEDEEQQQ